MVYRRTYGQSRSKKGFKTFWYKLISGVIYFLITLCFCWIISAVLLGSYRFLTNWSFFTLQDLSVQGNHLLSREEILQTAKIIPGLNTLSISIAGVEDRLSEHPWIKRVLVRRVLPDKLIISVEEKLPFFWVKKKNSIYYADKEGQSIAPVTAEKFFWRPFLKWEGGVEQIEVLDLLLRRLSEDNPPFILSDMGWIRFINDHFVEFFVQDWEIKVIMDLQGINNNWLYFQRVWSDLLQSNELNQVSYIIVYEQMAWVRTDKG